MYVEGQNWKNCSCESLFWHDIKNLQNVENCTKYRD